MFQKGDLVKVLCNNGSSSNKTGYVLYLYLKSTGRYRRPSEWAKVCTFNETFKVKTADLRKINVPER